MKHRFLMKSTVVFLIFLLTIANTGCTKEKAEAIKNGAERFRVEAKTALEMTREAIKQSISMPAVKREENIKKIANDFKGLKVDPSKPESVGVVADFIEKKVGQQARFENTNQVIDAEFAKTEKFYDEFARMFQSLPQGNFFAKSAVKDAKAIAVKLTIQCVKTAHTVQAHPYQLTARHTLLTERYLKAAGITDTTEKSEAILLASQDVQQLQDDETAFSKAIALQCFKAAEAGKLVTDLIDRYQSLTVNDILDLTRNALGIIGEISGNNADLKALTDRYENFIKDKVNADPLWKDILDREVDWKDLFSTTAQATN